MAIVMMSPVFGMFDRQIFLGVSVPVSIGVMFSVWWVGDPYAALIQSGSAILLLVVMSLNKTLVRQTRSGFVSAIERERLVEELDRRVRRDELTKAPNRLAFTELLSVKVSQEQACGLLMIDLDGFKVVNDVHGHAVGDQLLIEVARRIAQLVGRQDRVFRLGGDEFAVIVDEPEQAEEVGHTIVESVSREFDLDGVRVHVGASVGVATLLSAVGVDEVIARADRAMYTSKAAGRNRTTVYRSTNDSYDVSRSAMEAALENSEFVLRYQPIVDLVTGEILAFEALARWRHADASITAPDQFIPHIEANELHQRFGGTMIMTALRDHARLNAAGLLAPGTRVHVNVSPAQLDSVEGVDVIAACVSERSFDLSALTIEITESALLGDRATIASVLAACRSHNVEVALDDFGTGYSSLSVLRDHRVDELKIDRSFTAGAVDDPSCRGVISALVEFARHQTVTLTAEGVETHGQVNELLHLGVRRAQGFLFAQPMAFDELRRYLMMRAVHTVDI